MFSAEKECAHCSGPIEIKPLSLLTMYGIMLLLILGLSFLVIILSQYVPENVKSLSGYIIYPLAFPAVAVLNLLVLPVILNKVGLRLFANRKQLNHTIKADEK